MQQRTLDMSRKVKVRCVHRDVADYPLVPVSIKFRGKTHRMEVAVNPHLKHPLILGTDWPAFTQLLGIVCADVSWQTGRGQEEAAAQAGKALAGPSTPASEETRASEGFETSWAGWLSSGAVAGWDAQKRVWSGPLCGWAASPAGRPSLLPLLFPYKREVVSGNPRCPVKRGDNPVISSQKYPHCTPMAGHLGEAKTRERLMARFFWPGIHENARLLLPVSTNVVTLVPKPGRKEGHAVREPSLLRGIAVLRRSGSRK